MTRDHSSPSLCIIIPDLSFRAYLYRNDNIFVENQLYVRQKTVHMAIVTQGSAFLNLDERTIRSYLTMVRRHVRKIESVQIHGAAQQKYKNND